MKSYGLDYVAGSNARKLEFDYDYDENSSLKEKKQSLKKDTNVKPSMSTSSKVKIMLGVITVFSMLMVVTYRYNMISEANLKTIELKSELESVSSDLSLAMMNLEQSKNLKEIESYAKQKLGMQKPSKNQIVYVDSSTVVSNVDIKSGSSSSMLDGIKSFFSKLR